MIREKERELDGEKRRKRKTEESKDLACNNMPGKLIPVKLVNQERIESERGFSSSIESRGNPSGLFTQEEEDRGRSFTGTFRPHDFQSILQCSAIIQPLTRGRSSCIS